MPSLSSYDSFSLPLLVLFSIYLSFQLCSLLEYVVSISFSNTQINNTKHLEMASQRNNNNKKTQKQHYFGCTVFNQIQRKKIQKQQRKMRTCGSIYTRNGSVVEFESHNQLITEKHLHTKKLKGLGILGLFKVKLGYDEMMNIIDEGERESKYLC